MAWDTPSPTNIRVILGLYEVYIRIVESEMETTM